MFWYSLVKTSEIETLRELENSAITLFFELLIWRKKEIKFYSKPKTLLLYIEHLWKEYASDKWNYIDILTKICIKDNQTIKNINTTDRLLTKESDLELIK